MMRREKMPLRSVAGGGSLSLFVATAYWATGRLAALVAAPAGYATAIWPPAGIALAAALLAGPRVLPGIWLGAFLIDVELGLRVESPAPLAGVLAVSVVLAAGAALQAWAGAWLTRRFAGDAVRREGRTGIIPVLLATGPASCLINPTLSVALLDAVGATAATGIAAPWWIWFGGDVTGVLLFAPLLLVWRAPPWNWRLLRTVAVPVVLLLVATLAAFSFVKRREDAETERIFRSGSEQSALLLEERMGRQLAVPHGLAELSPGSDGAPRTDIERIAAQLSMGDGAMQLSDVSASAAPAVLFTSADFEVQASQPEAAALRWQTTFVAAGREWRLEVLPTQAFLAGARRPLVTWGVLAAGLLLTAFVQSLLMMTTGRAERIERLVAERTSELARSNAALNAEILERVQAETRLAEREQQWDQLIENLPLMVFVKDARDLRYVRLNREAERITGCKEEQVLGRRDADLYPRQQAEFYAGCDRQVIETGEMFEIADDPMVTPHGVRSMHTRKVRVLGADGQPRFILGISVDTTERRETEKALRSSEERFRLAMLGANDGLWEWNLASGESYYSPRWKSMLGYAEGELPNRPDTWTALIHPDDLPPALAVMRDLVEARSQKFELEFRMRHKDGHDVYILSRGFLMLDARGEMVRLIGTHVDISERKRFEEALRASDERQRLALQAAELGTWEHDIASDEFRADARAREHYGFGAQDITLADVLERVHPDDVAAVRRAAEIAWDPDLGEGRYAQSYRVVLPNGAVRWLSVQARLHFAGEGAARRASRAIGISRDITEQKNAEAYLLRSQKLEALGTLAAGIAHDFNNILLAISGNTKLAEADLPLDHPAQQSLSEIAKASTRARDLVRRILTFGRAEEQRTAALDPRPALEEAVSLLRQTLPARVELRVDLANAVPPINLDRTRLHQIVVNLATNAAHALGDHGGWIAVRLGVEDVSAEDVGGADDLRLGPHVCLEVSDNGCGIDRETLDRIFDPFFTTKPAGLGTGLGLSVVHGIMRSCGGAVRVDSRPGQGTTFRLYFPICQTAPAAEPSPARVVLGGQGQRVLYVDDDDALVFMLRRLLGRLGYAVTGCGDAASALAEFRSRPGDFDVVVTDLSMPGMSGFDLSRELLADRPDLPILMTSGYVRAADEEQALRLGIRAVVQKPDTVEGLSRALDELFRRSAPA